MVFAGNDVVEDVTEITNGDMTIAVFHTSRHKGALEFSPNLCSLADDTFWQVDPKGK